MTPFTGLLVCVCKARYKYNVVNTFDSGKVFFTIVFSGSKTVVLISDAKDANTVHHNSNKINSHLTIHIFYSVIAFAID